MLASMAIGCGLNTAVLQPGGNGRKGVLLNYSCGAHPCDPIDRTKPTIVITHGWNPLPERIHTTFGCAGANAIKCRCGDSFNILSWDWNAVKVSPFNDEPLRVGMCQGRMLAAALRCRGVEPCRTQIIAHSLGTIAAAQAALCLSDRGPMRQLTLLDPPEQYHEEIFCCLGATRHACVVENYWSPGISGYGAHVDCRGVRNYVVKGTTPIRGIVDLSISNHVYVMRWYYKTMRCPSMRRGFQNSCLLDFGLQVVPQADHFTPASASATLSVWSLTRT
jgi:pimeloyl-ACP methyl ester carboxylesterase